VRQNLEKAAAVARYRDGVGPIYRHLLARERLAQARFGVVGNMRRPRYLLDQLEAGETVEVSVSKVPWELRPPGCGERIIVTSDM
jgi:hypothetical protein